MLGTLSTQSLVRTFKNYAMAAVRRALQYDDNGNFVPVAKYLANNGDMLNNFNHMSLETFLYSNDPNSSGGKCFA
jgi:hypothetical protein